jgi:aspartyl-tRNA synthetase
MMRTHTCGELRPADVGKAVTLCGWVATKRDHGGVLFLDLRDRYGITQATFRTEKDAALYEKARHLGLESVLAVRGAVAARPADKANPKLATGGMELEASSLEILNGCLPLPFEISDAPVSNELRLEHRYLDLRRPKMQRNLAARHRLVMAVRKALDAEGFVEVETPILYKSTPEGAREYLVPSRVHRGRFYALPMSPQVFKQLCMVAGFDRYFQIARCFRDEDLRADRQPEFTQIDLEMSFVEPDDIFGVVERMLVAAYREVLGVTLPVPFPRVPCAEVMLKYGSDKPDRRFGMEISDVTDLTRDVPFKVFSEAPRVRGFAARSAAALSRKQIDELAAFCAASGAKGLAWLKVAEEGITGGIEKFIPEEVRRKLAERLGAKPGDLLCFVADRQDVVEKALGQLRLEVAKRLSLKPSKDWDFHWVVDFPLFVPSETEGKLVSGHHPFTAPHPEDLPRMETAPLETRALQYDLVLNGHELAGGSIRIHRSDVQARVFGILGIPPEEARQKFGFLLDALARGAPPHGGIAPGLDRLCALMLGEEDIREVIAFPKTHKATCLMTGSPSPVPSRQLKELGILIEKPAPP